MNCRICQQPARLGYMLFSESCKRNVQSYYCPACDAYFTTGTAVNYEHIDDFDLVGYYLKHESTIQNRYQKVFKYVETLIRPGTFLDVGAGIGFSLDVATRRGWTAKGLEPNKDLADHARARGNIVENVYLTETMSGDFDFVLIDNVLEHILQPAEFLLNSTRLLKSSGIMMIAVPPVDWLRKGLSSSNWVRRNMAIPQINIFYDVDQHVNMFSRRSMRQLLARVGLRLLDVRFHHSIAYNNSMFRGLGLDDGYYYAVKK